MSQPHLVAADPAAIDALMQQAIALHNQGEAAQALALYQQALALAPGHPQIHYLAGAALLALGQGDAAAQHFDAALSSDAQHLEALLQRGLLHLQAGEREAARQCMTRITQIAPADPRGYINLAAISLQLGDQDAAQQAAERAVQLAPKNGDAWNNLGNVRLLKGDFAQAETAFRQALQAAPGSAAYWQNLADTLRSAGRLQEAEGAYRQALALDDKMVGCWCNYGNLLGLLNREIEARDAYRRALEIDPAASEAQVSLAGHQIESGEEQAAITALRPIIESGRATADHIAVYAYALRAAGDLDAAQAILLRHIGDQTTSKTLVYAFGQLALARKEKVPQAVQEVHRWLREHGSNASMADRSTMQMLLAQLLDKSGQTAQAFAAATESKRLKGQRSSPAAEQALAAALEQAFTPARLRRAPYGLTDENRLVFIVGMPRSGTSLLEQMLAAHPAVHPCGEVGELERIAQEVGGADPLDWPRRAANLDAGGLQSLAARYLHVLGPDAAKAERLTDKMPHNFVNLGFIHLLFPRARIIHIQRDPRDVALSIYLHDFAGHHPYANHIEDIAHHILFYQRCMAHWRAALPEDSLHELHYEDLVADPETHARKVLQFIGLPWNDAVMRPQAVSRTVVTSSRFQVQEPIHRRAAGRWQPYARQLEPLARLLRQHGALPS